MPKLDIFCIYLANFDKWHKYKSKLSMYSQHRQSDNSERWQWGSKANLMIKLYFLQNYITIMLIYDIKGKIETS